MINLISVHLYIILTYERRLISMESLVQSMVTGFSSTASSMLTAIGSIVPVMLPIVGGIAVIGLGVKIFKKLS